MPGGIYSGPVQNTRDAFAERGVEQQQSSSNFSQQTVSDLQSLQPLFDLSGNSGISAAINNLFNSFSALSVNPNDTVARQSVLTQAQTTSQAFQQAATGILQTGQNVNQELQSTVADINQLGSQIAQLNEQHHLNLDGSVDAGVDAQLYSNLEQLSQDVGFTLLQQPDGTVNVYLGGQTPLVVGDTAFQIQGNFSLPQAAIMDYQGNDVTSQFTTGKLGSLLQTENTTLPDYMNQLNTLASSLADQVNTTLANGLDENGQAPTTDLFTYNAAEGAAYTMSVNSLTPDQIAAASVSAPGGNGNALALAALANADTVNGYTFSQAFGNLGGQLGGDISNAQAEQTTASSLLTQAQNVRQQVSGVSLDQEASTLLQWQQSYEATAKMYNVLNTCLDAALGILPAAT
jgi:flagellar hook-associated protein 1 FlgK